MVQRRHQVRLAGATFADDGYWARLGGPDGLDGLHQIMRGVGDSEEGLCADLRGAGLAVVGELDGSALEQLAPELFAQL